MVIALGKVSNHPIWSKELWQRLSVYEFTKVISVISTQQVHLYLLHIRAHILHTQVRKYSPLITIQVH